MRGRVQVVSHYSYNDVGSTVIKSKVIREKVETRGDVIVIVNF